MNIYGKDATAFYDLHGGLRLLKRGQDQAAVPVSQERHVVEELEEFAAAIRGKGRPGGRRRLCHGVARRGAGRHPVGARGTTGRGRGDFSGTIENDLSLSPNGD